MKRGIEPPRDRVTSNPPPHWGVAFGLFDAVHSLVGATHEVACLLLTFEFDDPCADRQRPADPDRVGPQRCSLTRATTDSAWPGCCPGATGQTRHRRCERLDRPGPDPPRSWPWRIVQHNVARVMTGAVIDLFEVVQVHVGEAQGLTRASSRPPGPESPRRRRAGSKARSGSQHESARARRSAHLRSFVDQHADHRADPPIDTPSFTPARASNNSRASAAA